VAASVEFMKPSSRTIRREERRISLMSDSLISDGGVMAIGAGEVNGYNTTIITLTLSIHAATGLTGPMRISFRPGRSFTG
jgi:hypothetical protein